MFLAATLVCWIEDLVISSWKLDSFFSRTTWVCQYQKGKPFCTLMKQEMMGWQWHQLDYMQIICTSLQTDNHTSTSSWARHFSCCPTNSGKAPKAASSIFLQRINSLHNLLSFKVMLNNIMIRNYT